jgi:hypothetical protein
MPLPLQLLFFIQGTGQTAYGLTWGNGFVTNSTLITRHSLSDPNPFFKALLTKAYRNKVRGCRHTRAWLAGWLNHPLNASYSAAVELHCLTCLAPGWSVAMRPGPRRCFVPQLHFGALTMHQQLSSVLCRAPSGCSGDACAPCQGHSCNGGSFRHLPGTQHMFDVLTFCTLSAVPPGGHLSTRVRAQHQPSPAKPD